jgi:hypothetical protein
MSVRPGKWCILALNQSRNRRFENFRYSLMTINGFRSMEYTYVQSSTGEKSFGIDTA